MSNMNELFSYIFKVLSVYNFEGTLLYVEYRLNYFMSIYFLLGLSKVTKKVCYINPLTHYLFYSLKKTCALIFILSYTKILR